MTSALSKKKMWLILSFIWEIPWGNHGLDPLNHYHSDLTLTWIPHRNARHLPVPFLTSFILWFSYIQFVCLPYIYNEETQMPSSSAAVWMLTSLNFFRLPFHHCKSCVYNCNDLFLFNSSPHSAYIWFSNTPDWKNAVNWKV